MWSPGTLGLGGHRVSRGGSSDLGALRAELVAQLVWVALVPGERPCSFKRDWV